MLWSALVHQSVLAQLCAGCWMVTCRSVSWIPSASGLCAASHQAALKVSLALQFRAAQASLAQRKQGKQPQRQRVLC